MNLVKTAFLTKPFVNKSKILLIVRFRGENHVFLPLAVGEGGYLSQQLRFIPGEELYPGVLSLRKHLNEVIEELLSSLAVSLRAIRGGILGGRGPRVTAMNYDRYPWQTLSWQDRFSLLIYLSLILNSACLDEEDIEGVGLLSKLLGNVVDVDKFSLHCPVIAKVWHYNQGVFLVHHSMPLNLNDVYLIGVDSALSSPTGLPEHPIYF